MARRSRRNHSPTFKAKVVLHVLKGKRTLAELFEQFDVHSNQIQDWKKQLVAQAANMLGTAAVAIANYAQVQQQLPPRLAS